jgi:predicted DNA-binding mobile mystery protein A
MTATQLAKRAGVTKSYVSNAEQAEQAESLTFKRMKRLADSLNCDFVYFLVPRQNVDTLLEEQATKVACKLLRKAGEHMSLEGQQLGPADQEREVKRLAQELIYKMPRNFWDEDQ